MRELGLGFGETADVAVLEYKAYPHLDAMRYRLRLLQTLVCMTSHVITEAQVRADDGPQYCSVLFVTAVHSAAVIAQSPPACPDEINTIKQTVSQDRGKGGNRKVFVRDYIKIIT